MLALLTLPPGCGLQMWQACTWFQINKKLLGNFKKFEPKHSQHFYQLNSLPPATAWQELILLHCSGLYQVSWSLQNAVDGSHTTVMTNCICLYRCLLPLSAWVKYYFKMIFIIALMAMVLLWNDHINFCSQEWATSYGGRAFIPVQQNDCWARRPDHGERNFDCRLSLWY